MRDADVRRVLLDEFASQASPDTLVIDELDLCGLTRVDVAVLNGHLMGYEIKGSTTRSAVCPARSPPAPRCSTSPSWS